MPKITRHKTRYPGVYYIFQRRLDKHGVEKTFYILYRRCGEKKLIEEPVGRESSGMTAATANNIRGLRAIGKELSNVEKRKKEKEKQQNQKVTLQTIWDKYQLIYSEKKSLKQDISRVKYLSDLMHKSPDILTTNDIDTLRKKLTLTKSSKGGASLSPASIKHILVLLKRLINFGIQRNLCIKPQNLYIDMPKVDNQKTEILSKNQLKNLLLALDAEPNQSDVAFIRLALVTGMRKSALLALKWSDCDFENNIITLSGNYAKKGKTDYIPMNNSAKSILLSIPKGNSDFIFATRNGTKRTTYNQRLIKRIKEKAKLPKDFRPLHGLRHNFASRLASSGKVDLYTIQRLLTHETPAMTQRYAHLHNDALKKAAAIIDDEFTETLS
ncbi:site-specific integrase [Lawsonia intracellularis]|uniref:Integrase n=1 Tax=Lawsonia intracellularis (strain PHE/MN1-00) TaxID=363253 RepID=Q1MNY2_LAWIP|nr:site-specific integrase [Lawsonia intracellularis]AGC50671.1 integrase [Lawsonia intracellularis N343]KAA0204206.1 site-specific integrase [Lawsonia intracellularis]MBZ3893297.1 site-specific integrase [Lawsonia intracellularis]OMQ01998.1 integrase [Lawsonia intracellularis]RBN31859.1 site-specific integrase [Lawsonia intracellularis]